MRLRHYDHDGRARFITFCTHKRIPFLTRNRFRRIIIDAISEVKASENFSILGYVIMPEHVHMVVVPKVASNIGPLVGEIKRLSSQRIHEIMIAEDSRLLTSLTAVRNGAEQFVCWQRRCYDHNCRTDEEIWKTVTYCHNNPVKRGLVTSPDRWRWSSFEWYQGESDVVLEMDSAG